MKTLLLALFALNLWGQDFDAQMRQAYLENDQRADLSCFYYNPSNFKLVRTVGSTEITPGEMKRGFELLTSKSQTSMDFEVFLTPQGDVHYLIKFQNGEVLSDKISKIKEREFYLPLTSRPSFNQKFEISKIYCSINFAKEEPLELEEKTHLNVHPHSRYDYLDLTTDKAANLFRNSKWSSLILLEEGNYKGNLVDLSAYLAGEKPSLPQNFYESNARPAPETKLVVSPAGHNRFVIKSEQDLEILFTGGNHNYCIWNNTRNLLYAYLRSPFENEISVIYDTQAIVAQRRGIIGGLSFPWRDHRRSNLLADLFKNSSSAKKYHQNYFNYFLNDYLNPFKGLFSELIFEYQSAGFSQTSRVLGQGKRKLKIKFIYR